MYSDSLYKTKETNMVCLEVISSRKGIAAAFFAIFSLSLSDMLVYASGYVSHPLIIIVWNSTVICLLSVVGIALTASTVSQPNLTNKILLLCFTGMLKGIADIALTSANIYATPGDAIAVLYTMPVFTMVFSIIFLGEKCRVSDIILTGCAIIGVVFISKPDFISRLFESNDSYNNTSNDDSDGDILSLFHIGIILALCSSAMNAAALVVGRFVGDCDLSPLFILLLVGLSEITISVILCSILGLWTAPASPLAAIKLIGVGVAGFLGLLGMFSAVANERPTVVSIVMAFQVVIVFVGQFFLFNLRVAWTDVVGVVFLVTSCIGATLMTSEGSSDSSPTDGDDTDDNSRHQMEESELLLLAEKQR